MGWPCSSRSPPGCTRRSKRPASSRSRHCASAEARPTPKVTWPGTDDQRLFAPEWLPVVAAVLFNYWFLRAEVFPVAYLNDSSVHEQMVRFATARLKQVISRRPAGSRTWGSDHRSSCTTRVSPPPWPGWWAWRSDRTGPSRGACTCWSACGRSRSTWGPAPCDSNAGPRRPPPCCLRSSSAPSASASRPRPTCGPDSASGPSCGPCSPCPWPGGTAGRRSAKDAGICPPSQRRR